MDVPAKDLERQRDAIEEGNPNSWDPFTTEESNPDVKVSEGGDKTRDRSDPLGATDEHPLRDSATPTIYWDPVAATNDKSDPVKPINIRESEGGEVSKPTNEAKSKPPSAATRSFHSRPKLPTMSSGAKKLCWAFACVILIVILGVLAASLKKVPSTEMGVQYNVHKKQLEDAAKSGGLFLGPPGYKFIKFPSTFITVDLNDRICVSNDGLLVTFSVTFQYQMTTANVLPAIIKYRDFHKWASMVEQAGLSAVHHSCSEFLVSEFQNKRGVIQSTMEDNLKLKLEGNETSGEEGVHAVAVSLQLTYIHLPEEYNEAVSQKQAAEEDIALAVAQRTQETTKADTLLLKAREEARKIRDTAENEAEVLMTEARLQAEETLFSFEKEAEALVQVKEELNLTTEGVLAYLSNRLLSEASSLKITTGEPAKLSQRDELSVQKMREGRSVEPVEPI